MLGPGQVQASQARSAAGYHQRADHPDRLVRVHHQVRHASYRVANPPLPAFQRQSDSWIDLFHGAQVELWLSVHQSAGDHPIRYTAAGDSVFAFVRDPSGTVTLPDVRATPTTAVETIDGTPLPWNETRSGLEVELLRSPSGPEPVVLVLRRVEARPVAAD